MMWTDILSYVLPSGLAGLFLGMVFGIGPKD